MRSRACTTQQQQPSSALSWPLTATVLSADKVCLSGGWYLDSLKTTPGHFDGWDYYLQEPTDFEGTAAQKKLVMGGKARRQRYMYMCCRPSATVAVGLGAIWAELTPEPTSDFRGL